MTRPLTVALSLMRMALALVEAADPLDESLAAHRLHAACRRARRPDRRHPRRLARRGTVRGAPPTHAARIDLPFAFGMRYQRPVTDLTPIESEFATSEDAAAHDAWFRAKVERAMASTQPHIPHDEVMAMARRVIDRHRNG